MRERERVKLKYCINVIFISQYEVVIEVLRVGCKGKKCKRGGKYNKQIKINLLRSNMPHMPYVNISIFVLIIAVKILVVRDMYVYLVLLCSTLFGLQNSIL